MYNVSVQIIKKRIYYHDTDSGGVVYYANYLKYLEEGRSEYFRDKGVDIKSWSQKGFWFVVRRVEIDYTSPANYGDDLDVGSDIIRIKNVSLVFRQEVRRGDKVLVSADTVLVCVDSSFSPAPLPDEIAGALKS